jgi:hypothetical protein
MTKFGMLGAPGKRPRLLGGTDHGSALSAHGQDLTLNRNITKQIEYSNVFYKGDEVCKFRSFFLILCKPNKTFLLSITDEVAPRNKKARSLFREAGCAFRASGFFLERNVVIHIVKA